MRIVQVINHAGLDRGGAERLARGLHQDLVEKGLDAHLVTLEECDLRGLPNSQTLGFASPRNPRALLRLGAELRELAGPKTVVHAHLFPATLHVSALRRLGHLRGPCSMTEHNTWNRRRRHPALRGLDRAIYAGFDQIAAISDQALEALVTSYPTLQTRSITIRNGAYLRFSTVPQRTAVSSEPCILTVARLAPVKNLAVALQALARLTDRPWRYVIAGSGSEEQALKQLSQELGLSDRVQFLGTVLDVGPLLAQSDLFLIPSRWEGFGLAAVEAMNAGLPVVASNVPGLREVVVPAGNPVVDPDDIAGLAAEIAGLLDDPARRARLGDAGFAESLHYDKADMTKRYLSLWSDLTKGATA